MAFICDTSGMLALYDASNVEHAATVAVIESEPGEPLVPVVLLAEIDYLLHTRLGAEAARDLLRAPPPAQGGLAAAKPQRTERSRVEPC